MQHKIKTYKDDSFKEVEFCEVCGKEGLELKINPQCEKIPVDKQKDRN